MPVTKSLTWQHYIISLFFISFFSFISKGQGRLVRGVGKIDFSLMGTQADFYVSPKGKDDWSGKLAEPNQLQTDGPFATIERARIAVRELKKQVFQLKKPAIEKRFIGTPHRFGSGRDILVLIRQGIYNLDKTLVFEPIDGGERVETDLPTGAFEYHELKDYFVTYAAYPGEKPVISGGVNVSGWKKGKQGKWTTTLQRGQVSDLYANNTRLQLARSPNTGYYLTDGQPSDSAWFQFKDKDIQPWKGLENGRVRMVVRWGSFINSINKIDLGNRKAWLKKPSPEILLVPPRYYIENVEALLDTAGEWFFNLSTRLLSFIPNSNIANPNKTEMMIPLLSELVRVDGKREEPVRNLRFYNLGFKNTAPGGNAAISAQYVKNCEWLNNHIENLGQTAILLGKGSYHNLISKNIINDGRGAGIIVAGVARPETWADFVSDNSITYNQVSSMLPAGVGIGTYNATRSEVLHNYVTNTGSYGIIVGSWPNIEETSDGSHVAAYNHVSYATMEVDDEGGIAVFGMSPGSRVHHNLVHDVRPAGTNENVGFFFQNMSLGWTVTDNIYYNLKQGEMKYCAAYAVDNVYQNNYVIDPPAIAPEMLITSKPDLKEEQLKIESGSQVLETGKDITISAMVFNEGSTGTAEVMLYIDGKVADKQLFPSVAKNWRPITFKYRFAEPGEHRVSIGATPEKLIRVAGDPHYFSFQQLKTPSLQVAEFDSVIITTDIQNLRDERVTQPIELLDHGKVLALQPISFDKHELKTIRFAVQPGLGTHSFSIGPSAPLEVRVYAVKKMDIGDKEFLTYCSTTAQPCSFEFDPKKNHFEITASGTDFLHAEDSYGTIFMKQAIEGNFVATVKLISLSKDISEWFRAGIFVRNNLANSHSSEKGSLGSFLLFSTTKRSGAQWDEFGDGCMHNTKSKNYLNETPIPVWLKLVRHGNRFTGYYSFDGKTWELSRESGDLPGLSPKMDIGLAGGANDQRASKVVFEDFQLWMENK